MNNDTIAVPERRKSPDENARILVGIKAAIVSYYLDLDARKHGGIAQDHAFNKIERMLGMSWDDHKAELAQANPVNKEQQLHEMFQATMHPKA